MTHKSRGAGVTMRGKRCQARTILGQLRRCIKGFNHVDRSTTIYIPDCIVVFGIGRILALLDGIIYRTRKCSDQTDAGLNSKREQNLIRNLAILVTVTTSQA